MRSVVASGFHAACVNSATCQATIATMLSWHFGRRIEPRNRPDHAP